MVKRTEYLDMMIKIKQIFCRHSFKDYAVRKSMFPYSTWDRACKCEAYSEWSKRRKLYD